LLYHLLKLLMQCVLMTLYKRFPRGLRALAIYKKAMRISKLRMPPV